MNKVIGVMSGTSLDGIDICYVDFKPSGFEILNYTEIDFLDEVKEKIIKAINDDLSISQLTSLDYELGFEYARAIKLAMKAFKIQSCDIDVIANHGQTIYHNDSKPGTIDSTMQLGCGDILKEQMQIDVVTNFRAADIAVGNKGAPLVQIFDKYLIDTLNLENCCFLNIGGISNIYIDQLNKSFDTGPGNMMINYAMKKFYNLDFDRDGKIAYQGDVNIELLEFLLKHEYFQNTEQLSTGREDFGDQYTESVLNKFEYLKNEDIISTLTKFTADSITVEVLKNLQDVKQTIYVSGGGVYNKTLLKFLQENFENIIVLPLDEIGIGANLKEAAAFAYFGFANYNNIKLETQNGRETILGTLHKRG